MTSKKSNKGKSEISEIIDTRNKRGDVIMDCSDIKTKKEKKSKLMLQTTLHKFHNLSLKDST